MYNISFKATRFLDRARNVVVTRVTLRIAIFATANFEQGFFQNYPLKIREILYIEEATNTE